jgi:phage-related protein
MKVDYISDDIFKFISKLDPALRGRVFSTVDLLRDYGQKISLPDSRALGSGLFELRIVGNNHIRILYCYHNSGAVLLHIFKKKSNGISSKDLRPEI